ncbi:MAG: helix-turn-helix transcriptional regulator [Lachnospiraceae bacterium]|nr:helix-turn-helix transcriptional regulator [Lachnospiraceae bacterium]
MTLGDRLHIILKERHIKQVDFAKSLGISANYINLLISGKRGPISDTLAKLIEETYGYSAQWIMTGEGEKISTPSLSTIKIEFLKKIQKMPDDEIVALLAFANSLENIKKSFSINN